MNTPTKPVEQKARELVETVAREMCLVDGDDPDAKTVVVNGNKLVPPYRWEAYRLKAAVAVQIIKAALNTDEERIRREAFEEAAKVAEGLSINPDDYGAAYMGVAKNEIASAIRALSTPSKEVGR
jgi:hypothetical protein